jgi:hypothetical protein
MVTYPLQPHGTVIFRFEHSHVWLLAVNLYRLRQHSRHAQSSLSPPLSLFRILAGAANYTSATVLHGLSVIVGGTGSRLDRATYS